MKKLLALYKGLPTELRTMIAMAGLGSPIGAIYLLKRYLFPGMSLFMVILIVAGAVAALALLAYLISRLLGRGSRKRKSGLAGELAEAGAAGSTAPEGRAAIKANNEKFFNAVSDMRRNLGLSVYDLPWYIVIGDSGCGKTRLINEGGLTFSTGKPEGYQLGTLNYNWWFTEDAIFVDMAGRLCNPKDDADRREWEAFLATIAKGRRGFPINGALVCISADHLLQDSPEKIEQDANTILERLRDLQTKLGVTFATYVTVTKSDKILGFMQFFDRAERDITVKNQIFGWSKPGSFNELYDPEQFDQDFGHLYARLNDLRLARLHDDADEIDLGLAYGFPEEFRHLLSPLQIYIRTLFPMIKNPRAIKNLIFRGAYFTSATQEGALILKNLTERLGPEAASQFAPLDLYPNKRPHFIKDLLFRKVFPEHGLVFRNEEQVLRNRKMTRLLKWGGTALFALLLAVLVISSYKFGDVIGTPRSNAAEATPNRVWIPADALNMTHVLADDVQTLQANLGWARILSLGFGAREPITDLDTIRSGLFEHVLLRETLAEVSQALRSADLLDPRAGAEARQTAQTFMDAFEQYVAWFACAKEDQRPQHLEFEGFRKLCAIVSDKKAIVVMDREALLGQASAYFTLLGEGTITGNPARTLLHESMDAVGTIHAALRTVHRYLAGYAALDASHPDPLIAEWLRVRDRCAAIDSSYVAMLDSAGQAPQTLEELQTFKAEFVGRYERFAEAVDACTWRGAARGVHVIIDPLRPALLSQRAVWLEYQSRLEATFTACTDQPNQAVRRAIASLGSGSDEAGLPGLDRVLWASLRAAGFTEREYNAGLFDSFDEVVQDVPARYEHILHLDAGGGTRSDRLLMTDAVGIVGSVLRGIRDHLSEAKLGPAEDGGSPAEWIAQMERLLDVEDFEGETTLAPLPPIWQRDRLLDLYSAHLDLIALGEGRRLLSTMHERFGSVGTWGIAELAPDWNEKVPSVFQIPIPHADRDRAGQRDADNEKKPTRRKKRGRRGRRSRGGAGQEHAKVPTATIDRDRLIPACATRRFLAERSEECGSLLYDLHDFGEDFYFASDEDPRPLNLLCIDRLERAGAAYMATYVRAWASAYEGKRLVELDRLTNRADTWLNLVGLMEGGRHERGSDEVGDELQTALAEVLENVPFWAWYFDDETGEWTSDIDPGDREWREVASWMQEAFESHWPADSGRFVVDARLAVDSLARSDPADPPWQLLAEESGRRWKDLSKAIGACGKLPTTFQSDSRKTDRLRIPWGSVDSLRRDARLGDERLTGALVAFERHAQRLLSTSLTDVVCTIQARYFRDLSPYDGWPYLDEGGHKANNLRTVEFAGFKQFIREIERAWKELEPLEETLPRDDPFWAARSEFYARCREWARFLQLNDQLVPEDLWVDIEGADPVTEPFGKERVHDTAQHYFETVALDLGLTIREVDEQGGDSDRPLRMPTLTAEKAGKPRRAVWRWTARPGNTALTVSLIDGRRTDSGNAYPSIMRPLGDSSPLALCAYLHSHGVPFGDRWITSHAFDLVSEFKRKGKGHLAGTLDPDRRIVGEKFIFSLERPLPGPIRKLERP